MGDSPWCQSYALGVSRPYDSCQLVSSRVGPEALHLASLGSIESRLLSPTQSPSRLYR